MFVFGIVGFGFIFFLFFLLTYAAPQKELLVCSVDGGERAGEGEGGTIAKVTLGWLETLPDPVRSPLLLPILLHPPFQLELGACILPMCKRRQGTCKGQPLPTCHQGAGDPVLPVFVGFPPMCGTLHLHPWGMRGPSWLRCWGRVWLPRESPWTCPHRGGDGCFAVVRGVSGQVTTHDVT